MNILHLFFRSIVLLWAMGVALPVVALVYMGLVPSFDVWHHLIQTILPTYTKNTVVFMGGTAILAFVWGTVSAWLVTVYDIYGRRIFAWALLLPMAMPTYVVAFVYAEFLEFSGPVQTLYRYIFGFVTYQDYSFPAIRSMGGAILLASLVFYPYVYLFARSAFLVQAKPILHMGQVQGCTPFQCFVKLAVPLSFPATMGGVIIVLMETISDFGLVSLFGVHTLTSGVYDVWFVLNDFATASQLAVVMVSGVFVLVLVKKYWDNKNDWALDSDALVHGITPLKLSGGKHICAVMFCGGIIGLGFVVPLGILLYNAVVYFESSYSERFISFAVHSLYLSGASAVAVMGVAVILVYANRIYAKNRWINGCVHISRLGYAIPGAILALGVFIPFARFDNWIDAIMETTFGINTGLLLSGSMFILIYAYVVRFLTLGLNATESAFDRIDTDMDRACMVYAGHGWHGRWYVLCKVYIPLIRSGLCVGAVLVFVDTMKELPATLLLSPFNFGTLATQSFQYASDQLVEQASLPAVLIVVVGILPVIVLSKFIDIKQ